MAPRPHPPLPPPERAFLLGALFHGALDAERLRRLAAGGLDWAALVAAAEAWRLGALLFDSIHAAGVGASVPGPLLDVLRAEAALVATRNAAMSRAASRAGQALAAAGIRAVALKGAALAVHAPRYHQVRTQGDVDLLVPRDRVRAAGRVLVEAGFQPHPKYATRLELDGRSAFDEAAPLPPGHHLLPLLSPEGATVELHFEPPGRLSGPALEAVRTGVVPGPGGTLAQALDPLLGLLCAHVHEHHVGDPVFLLRHLADVVALQAAGGSLDRVGPAFGPGVGRSARLVDEARRAVLDPGRRPLGLAEEALAGGPGGLAGLATAWRVSFRTRWWAALDGGRRALFPSPRYMAQRYGVGLRSPLLPLTYPWRFLSALGRALRGR